MHDEYGAVLDGEVDERALELVAIHELREFILPGRPFDIEVRQLDRSTARSPHLIVTSIDKEPMEPGVERLRVTEAPKVSP
jgi:hypothetical protein